MSNKNMKNLVTTGCVVGCTLMVAAEMVSGQITPLSAYRSLSASRFLQTSTIDPVQQFSQWQHPSAPQPWMGISRTVQVEGSDASIYQVGVATQTSELMQGPKLIDATLTARIEGGEWYRGLIAQGQAGASSNLEFSVRVTEQTEVQMFVYSYGNVSTSTSLTGNISMIRNGQLAFEWNATPLGMDYADGFQHFFSLTPGFWDFNAYVSGTSMGGASDGSTRGGDLAMSFAIVQIPSLSGAGTLLMAGVISMLRRRR